MGFQRHAIRLTGMELDANDTAVDAVVAESLESRTPLKGAIQHIHIKDSFELIDDSRSLDS